LVVIPKRRSWRGRVALDPSGKLTNQLLEDMFGLAELAGVSETDMGAKPIASVTARVMASASTGTRV
jgi:hypothetical protein